MIKKLIITTVVGTVFYFVVGWFIFDFVLGSYTDHNTTQLPGFKKNSEQLSLAFLVLSCSAYAALMSFVLVYLLNIKKPVNAFFIGSTIGILVAIMTDTYWYAVSNFYSNFPVVIFDILGAGIAIGSVGLVIAFINKKLG